MGVVGAVGGGGQTLPVRRLFSCTVLSCIKKEIEVVYTRYNYRLYSKSIHPEYSPLSHTKKRQKITSSTSPLGSFPTMKKSTFFVYKLTLL